MTRNLRISVRPVLRLLASLLALLGGPAVSQAVDSMSSGGQAPPAWVAYAQEATRTVIGWLNADESPASGIRAVLEQTRPAPDQPTPPLVVRIWVDPSGAITRVEFPPLSDAQATQDLRALLTSHRLEAPPQGMRQPMRLGLQLAPHPAQPANAATT